MDYLFNTNDFKGFSRHDFEVLFGAINEKLNGTLQLSNSRGAAGTNQNSRILAEYLNQRNAYCQIYGRRNVDEVKLEDIQKYIDDEHARLEFERLEDEEYVRLEAEEHAYLEAEERACCSEPTVPTTRL